jgi:hypothetical protein
MVLDPCLCLLDDAGATHFDQRLDVGERKRIQVEAAHEKPTPIDGGNLRVQDRVAPLMNGDTRREQSTIEAPRGRAGDRNVTSSREQQADLNATPSGCDDGPNHPKIGKKITVSDVDPLPRARKRFEISPAQAPASSETAQVNAQRAVDWPTRLTANHLSQAHTLRTADLERQVSPSEALALVQVLVADVDSAKEGHLIVDEQDFAMVAPETADEERQQAVVDADHTAGFAQGRGDCASGPCRAPTIDEHLHRHATSRGLPQRLDEAYSHAEGREGVHLQMHIPLRSRDGKEHPRISLFTAIEQLDRFWC